MATEHLESALEALETAAKALCDAAWNETEITSERASWLKLAARAARLADDTLEEIAGHQQIEKNMREISSRTHD